MSDKESKISPEVDALAGEIQKVLKIEVNGETGHGKEKEDDKTIYEKTLPENLTMDLAKQFSNHNANFIAAGGLAFGRVSNEALREHTGLKETEMTLKMAGSDHVDYRVTREQKFSNHLSGKDEEIVKYGVLKTSYAVKGGHNSGQLKHVRDQLNEEAYSLLKK